MKKVLIIFFTLTYISLMSVSQNKIQLQDIDLATTEDGQTHAQYKSDKRDLNGTVYIIKNPQYEGDYTIASFDNGYATGKWEEYQANKLESSLEYKNGYPDGEYIKMYFEYITERGNYKEGKKEGEWIETYTNGKKRRTMVYENDTLALKIEYHLEGGVKDKMNYKTRTLERFAIDGSRELTHVFYDTKTMLTSPENLLEPGQIVLKDIYYYPNGAIKSELFYKKNPMLRIRISKQDPTYILVKEIRYKKNGEIESEVIPKMEDNGIIKLEDIKNLRENRNRIDRPKKGKSK